MADDVLILLRGGPCDGEVTTVPDSRDTWYMPHISAERRGAFFFGTSCGPLPQPSVYRRTYPIEREFVLTKDVIVKRHTPLSAFELPAAEVIVFECWSAGGHGDG